MKKAAIVVGEHHFGKTRVINIFLKPMLKISINAWTFWLNGKHGCVLSQSFEETNKNEKGKLTKYLPWNYIIVAGRPRIDPKSKIDSVKKILEENGFLVQEFLIKNKLSSDDDFQSFADRMYNWIIEIN